MGQIKNIKLHIVTDIKVYKIFVFRLLEQHTKCKTFHFFIGLSDIMSEVEELHHPDSPIEKDSNGDYNQRCSDGENKSDNDDKGQDMKERMEMTTMIMAKTGTLRTIVMMQQ